MRFQYTARNGVGAFVGGERDATDKFVLAHELRKEGLAIISAEIPKKGWHEFMERLNESVVTVPLKEKINFANNLSAMLTAGLPLSRAVKILSKQTKNRKLKKVTADILEEVNSGGSLSDAIGKHERIFSSVFAAMVHAGEQSGNLPQSLKMIGDQLAKTYSIERKIKGAMIYPAVIVCIMILIAVLMLIFVVPTLTKTFSEMHVALPLPTRAIIFASSMLANHWFVVTLGTTVLIAVVLWFFRQPAGKSILNYLGLKMPIIGNIMRQTYAAKTSRTLSSLISSGVDVVQALETTKGVVRNPAYVAVLSEAQTAVQKGKTLAEVFQANEKLYPVLMSEMMEVGEETGNLAGMLLQTAVFYEDEVDAATKDMSTIIEPLLMLMIGAGVGFFAISIIQPIYSIGNSIS